MAYADASMAWGPEPRANRWGHHAPQVLVAAVVATVVLGVAPMPTGSLAAPLAPLLLLVVVIGTWLQMRRHDRGLCELCMASMPLDPARAAERHSRRLALAHLGESRRAVVAYLVVLIGSDVVLVAAPPAWSVPALLLWAGVQSTLIYLVLSHVTHRRLQPWCGRCGDNGDGRDDVGASGPVPVDSRSG